MDSNKLSNKAGLTYTGNWEISGKNIKRADGPNQGFTVDKDGTSPGTGVWHSEPLDPNKKGQEWKFLPKDEDGYSMVMNPNSKLYLTMVDEDHVRIQSKLSCFLFNF